MEPATKKPKRSRFSIEPNFKRLVDSLYDGVYFVDRDRTIVYWNSAAEIITGFSADEVVGKQCADSILSHVDGDGNRLCTSLCPLAETMKDSKPREAKIYLHHKAGHRVPIAVRINPVINAHGTVVGGVELFSDLSSQEATRSRVKELEQLSLLDHLTGLANRRYVEMELKNRLEEQGRYGWPFGILLLDVDHFKDINDRFGHMAGDAVLKAIAKTLEKNARPFDLFGRWGGDEFVGLVKNVTEKMLYDIGRRLRSLVKESFVVIDDAEITVTVSVGGTMSRAKDSPEALLQRADQLMYKSKQGGRNRFTMDLTN